MTTPSSPLPWKVDALGLPEDANGRDIFSLDYDGAIECQGKDAEFICRAVNSYHKMREALEKLAAMAEDYEVTDCGIDLNWGEAARIARAALKASEGI